MFTLPLAARMLVMPHIGGYGLPRRQGQRNRSGFAAFAGSHKHIAAPFPYGDIAPTECRTLADANTGLEHEHDDRVLAWAGPLGFGQQPVEGTIREAFLFPGYRGAANDLEALGWVLPNIAGLREPRSPGPEGADVDVDRARLPGLLEVVAIGNHDRWHQLVKREGRTIGTGIPGEEIADDRRIPTDSLWGRISGGQGSEPLVDSGLNDTSSGNRINNIAHSHILAYSN